MIIEQSPVLTVYIKISVNVFMTTDHRQSPLLTTNDRLTAV